MATGRPSAREMSQATATRSASSALSGGHGLSPPSRTSSTKAAVSRAKASAKRSTNELHGSAGGGAPSRVSGVRPSSPTTSASSDPSSSSRTS